MNRKNVIILEEVPFAVDVPALKKSQGLGEDSPFDDEIAALAARANEVARPRGAYHLAPVEHVDDETVIIDGVRFTSRILRMNLAEVGRAFPYLATCGRELDAWSDSVADPMSRFWTDAIKVQALGAAVRALGEDVSNRFQPRKRASMNPGSLPNWPISEQKPMFEMFGETAGAIGVQLTESFLMNPVKSVSGIWFETETSFENCQLCPREDCPGRRAPYNPELFYTRYGGQG